VGLRPQLGRSGGLPSKPCRTCWNGRWGHPPLPVLCL